MAKNKDVRTGSLAIGSVSSPRQKPNKMQYLDNEGTVSDDHTSWLNSVEKVRNREVQKIKKISFTALLSESKPQST